MDHSRFLPLLICNLPLHQWKPGIHHLPLIHSFTHSFVHFLYSGFITQFFKKSKKKILFLSLLVFSSVRSFDLTPIFLITSLISHVFGVLCWNICQVLLWHGPSVKPDVGYPLFPLVSPVPSPSHSPHFDGVSLESYFTDNETSPRSSEAGLARLPNCSR